MAISLNKGGNVSLTKEDASLKNLIIGLGWDARRTDGVAFDLDASLFILGANEKVRSDADFIFYNNLKSADGSIEHKGDNRTGDGDGDDEQIEIKLDKVPADVQKLAITVTIHEAEKHGLNFGQVVHAYIRCVNGESNREIARFDLSEDGSIETAMIFGEVYRHNSEWKFRAIAQGYQGGLRSLCLQYGIHV